MSSMNTIYLDYAAATPMDPLVFSAMEPYFLNNFYNPSATYTNARNVKRALETARGMVAHWLGARPSEVIFTAGTTEANNMVIRGVMDGLDGANIVVSSIEHESVLAPAHLYDCREVSVTPQGLIDLESLKAAIDDNTALVSVMYANNEVGTVQPIHQIGQLIQVIRTDRRKRGIALPLYFHTDAAQAANYLDLHVARLGVDFLSINGGKIYGPKQSGVLFVAGGAKLKPLVLGGGQERGVRSGTENVAGAIGLAQALVLAQEQRHDEIHRLHGLQHLFFSLLEEKIPEVVINGSRSVRLPNNVHITIPGQDNERLLISLDENGVLCAAGSACSASDEEPSHVLRAMGLSEADAQASLRFTMGRQTTEEMVRRAVDVLVESLAK